MSEVGVPDDSFAALLGHFLAHWGLAETCLMAPLMLTGTNQEAAASILASVNSTGVRLDVVMRALEASEDIPAEQLASIKETCSSFTDLCKTRNAISHHMWVTNATTGKPMTIDFRKPEKSRYTTWQPDDIKTLSRQVLIIARDLCAKAGQEWVTDADLAVLTP